VATELTIHFDGDGELLRVCDEVEFLASGHNRDFLEVVGKIN